jgi:hypothetical protein
MYGDRVVLDALVLERLVPPTLKFHVEDWARPVAVVQGGEAASAQNAR